MDTSFSCRWRVDEREAFAMSQTVVIELPDETVVRYQQGAAAARKPLEEFLVDRLKEAVPPYATTATLQFDTELDELNRLSDTGLWAIARNRLSHDEQGQYDELLEKNQHADLSPKERDVMEKLGNRARRITLHKAHALMILKWRGYALPAPDEMQDEDE
jgi:hypothetical protein